MDMRPASGRVRLDERGLMTVSREGETLYELNACQVKEALVLGGVGCGLVFFKMEDAGERVICRFTMSAFKQAGEFCKLVNYYRQTGHAAFPDEPEVSICPQCGRPLMEGLSICLFCYNKMTVIRRAASMLRPFRRPLITAELILVFSSLLYLLVPIFNRILIDDYLTPMQGTFSNILTLAGAMLLVRVVGEILFIFCSRMYNRAGMLYTDNLRNVAYGKMQRMSMNALAKRTPGDLIRRVMEDTATVKDFLINDGRFGVEMLLTFLVVLVILFFTDWRLTLLVFLPIPLVMMVLSRFWRLIYIRYERQWRKGSRANSILHDIIRGIRTVKSFGNEEQEIKKFARVSRELAEVSSANERMWATLFPSLTFITGIGEFLALYFGGRAILAGDMSLGVLVQFVMYIGYIYNPLRWLVSFPRRLADTLTGLVKVFEIVDEKPDIREIDHPRDVPLTGALTFENVSFGYKSYEPVLKDVSIRIEPGEMIGIVGRSGVGKSTMINLAMRLYDPGLGAIRIGDTDIRDMSLKHLHEQMGVVFQDTFLFVGTIYDNIAYAKPGANVQEVIAACKAANAHDFIMQTADGYQTMIGESGYSLSGGERQRLAIARAVIKNPSIMILDEATSSLDAETESAVQEGLMRLTKGRMTIAIAHRLSTLRRANRIIVLDKGGIAESGTHYELMRMKGIYYGLVVAQRKMFSSGSASAPDIEPAP